MVHHAAEVMQESNASRAEKGLQHRATSGICERKAMNASSRSLLLASRRRIVQTVSDSSLYSCADSTDGVPLILQWGVSAVGRVLREGVIALLQRVVEAGGVVDKDRDGGDVAARPAAESCTTGRGTTKENFKLVLYAHVVM